MKNSGLIYILTNPSFPKLVKIGYTTNLEKRLDDLNRSECIPFAFRPYAYYKVDSYLSDKKVHDIIDTLNPNLRCIEKYNGKERKKEFYVMTKEQAYSLLYSIASINNRLDDLVLCEQSSDDMEEENNANAIENTPIDLKSFYINKNEKVIKLHELLFEKFHSKYNDLYEEITPNYIAIRNDRGKNVCEVHLYKNKVCIVTREPLEQKLKIGNKVPDTYLWALNYKIFLENDEQIDLVVDALSDVYKQIKK